MNSLKTPSPKALALIAAAGLTLVVLIGFGVTLNGVQKAMVKREQALSAQYQANQNELSTFVSKVTEMMGVAETATEAQRTVLEDAVKGRYEGETGANPTGGAFFSAITEAYPDLAQNQALYGKVQDAVSSGREAYKNKQDKLLDMLREYETWKNSGFVHSKLASMVGAPSDNLVARVGMQANRGQDALDQMYVIVLTSQAKEAYETGEMDPLDLGPKSGE